MKKFVNFILDGSWMVFLLLLFTILTILESIMGLGFTREMIVFTKWFTVWTVIATLTTSVREVAEEEKERQETKKREEKELNDETRKEE